MVDKRKNPWAASAAGKAALRRRSAGRTPRAGRHASGYRRFLPHGVATLAVVALAFDLSQRLGPSSSGPSVTDAAPAGASCVSAQILSCYDGDTCQARFEGRQRRVRLAGFDTPELGAGARCAAEQQMALLARDRLRTLVAGARESALCPKEDDRYGRLVARLLLDGEDVAGLMIGEKLARPYAGGRREGWCD